jgi:ABC-type nitrate/sulfonate/bicarbonate transport system substrate-binding protein
MSKFNALAFVVICLFVAACAATPLTPPPAPTAPPEPTAAAKSGTLRFFDLVNLDVRDIPMLLALDDLQAQGYKVEKTYVASSTLITEALSKGDADIGIFNSQTAWTAVAKGAPIRTIIEFTGPTTIVAAKNEIADCHGLAGKRVGTPTTTGANPALVALYMHTKCSDEKFDYVVLADAAARSAALLSGNLDASLMPGEDFLKVQDQAPGKFHVLISFAQEYPDVLVDALHARREWLDQNPQLAHDFITAILKANRAIGSNPQLLYDEAAKRLQIDPAVAKEIADTHLKNAIWSSNGGLSAEKIQSSLDFYSDKTGLKKGMKVEDVADLSFLNKVLDEMGRK